MRRGAPPAGRPSQYGLATRGPAASLASLSGLLSADRGAGPRGATSQSSILMEFSFSALGQRSRDHRFQCATGEARTAKGLAPPDES